MCVCASLFSSLCRILLLIMSSATAVNNEESTLCNPNNPDDSLCTDEFEIISSDTLDNAAPEHANETVSQWTMQHSINVESLVPLNSLASLLSSTFDETQAKPNIPVENGGDSTAVPTMEHLGSLAAHPTLTTEQHETPVLAGTMDRSLAASTVTEASSYADSEATLENILRSQNETRLMLDKAIISLDSMNKERSEMVAKLASVSDLELEVEKLKSRTTELEKENSMLQKQKEAEMADKLASVNDLELEVQKLRGQVADLEKQNSMLQKQNENEKKVKVLKKSAEIEEKKTSLKTSSLEQNVLQLQQQLHDRGVESDTRAKALIEATNELESAYRKIADLTDSRDKTEFERIKLRDKLDETYALLVAERERVSVTEDQLRSFQSAGGSGFNMSMINEEAVVREMRDKAEYAKLLESELENTRQKLEDVTKDLRTHEEIINVLKEEDMEGRRVIAEKERKINELEEMVRSMGLERAEVNHSETHCWITSCSFPVITAVIIVLLCIVNYFDYLMHFDMYISELLLRK
ncbi:unnamed protein product [Cylicocyclus nassatus]|uniref:Uncharacterized protein n=1 Tax=Cylicocyclus nassatus TaxID=53992 RepID=A0AA36M8I1_CYLNA|nr:unnamed protein product [Cylicocyclus nassatus]